MTLTDAGPLIALLDRTERHHRTRTAALQELPPEPMLTTWPCFTEAMYLLGQAGGHRYRRRCGTFAQAAGCSCMI